MRSKKTSPLQQEVLKHQRFKNRLLTSKNKTYTYVMMLVLNIHFKVYKGET